MTTYVVRDGHLVDKRRVRANNEGQSPFPAPRLSRLEPYQSPIDGKEITSWGQRDKDLRDSNSYDPRDVKNERPRRPKQLDLFDA